MHLSTLTDIKLTKPKLITYIVLGSILCGSILFGIAFSPSLFYVNPYVNLYDIDPDDLKLKNISSMEIVGSPKLGINILGVSWPVWSDCGLPYLEVVQYNLYNKEINIWIWGKKGLCAQVMAFIYYNITIFIPFSGYWKIGCNNASIIIEI
ncbi:MAG: hypothetical protein ACFE94_01720 [Candidatus Hodarchaeota archaeon]